jgi:hypothetical protein
MKRMQHKELEHFERDIEWHLKSGYEACLVESMAPHKQGKVMWYGDRYRVELHPDLIKVLPELDREFGVGSIVRVLPARVPDSDGKPYFIAIPLEGWILEKLAEVSSGFSTVIKQCATFFFASIDSI